MRVITKESLENLYIQERKTMKECAITLGVSVGTVYNYIKKYGIKSRPRMTEETKTKISNALIGRPSIRKGCKIPEETKRKISESKKGVFFNPSEFGGHIKKRKDGYNYVYSPNHPMATKDGYVMEHILVMEKSIGRYITRDEVVHHKNRKRDDNRIENLQLMTFKEHAGLHMKERWEQKRGEKNAQ